MSVPSKRQALQARMDAAGWCGEDDDAVAEMVSSGWTRDAAIENVLEADIEAAYLVPGVIRSDPNANPTPPACDDPETCFDPGCGCKFRNGGR